MKFPWFRRTGLFFIPVKIMGWVILAGGLVYTVYIFMDIDSRSHSVSDTLMNFVFNMIIAGAVYSTIGYLTSSKWRD